MAKLVRLTFDIDPLEHARASVLSSSPLSPLPPPGVGDYPPTGQPPTYYYWSDVAGFHRWFRTNLPRFTGSWSCSVRRAVPIPDHDAAVLALEVGEAGRVLRIPISVVVLPPMREVLAARARPHARACRQCR